MLRLVSVLGLLLAWPAGAWAQSDDERARAHFSAGRSYFEQARYDDAIREWEMSYELSSRHVLLVNIANAHERALRPTEAIAVLERYLRVGGDEASGNRHTIETRITQLREMERRLSGGTTDPGTTDPGTTDPGTTYPGTTDPGTTDPGTTDPGTTDPGTTDPGTTDPGTTDPGTTDPGATDPGTEGPGPVGPTDPQPQAQRRVWSWVMLGATAAFGIVALSTGIVSMQYWNWMNDEEVCPNGNCGACEAPADGDWSCPSRADMDTGESLAVVTDVFIGLAAAAAVTTVLLFVLEPRLYEDDGADAQARRLSVAPWVASNGGGVAAALRF